MLSTREHWERRIIRRTVEAVQFNSTERSSSLGREAWDPKALLPR